MKTNKYFTFAAALLMTSFASLAAEPINQQQTQNLTKIGVVSVGQAATLSDLEAKLAAKAAAKGAVSYRITSAGGSNQLHGSAVIYK